METRLASAGRGGGEWGRWVPASRPVPSRAAEGLKETREKSAQNAASWGFLRGTQCWVVGGSPNLVSAPLVYLFIFNNLGKRRRAELVGSFSWLKGEELYLRRGTRRWGEAALRGGWRGGKAGGSWQGWRRRWNSGGWKGQLWRSGKRGRAGSAVGRWCCSLLPQQLEGPEHGVCCLREGIWGGWGGRQRSWSVKQGSWARQRKQHSGLKGRNLRFAWEEQRQQGYSSSAAIPLRNVEEGPSPLRVPTDHTAEVASRPTAAGVLLHGPPPLPCSVSPHPLCCPLLILPQTRARKQNGGEASHYCRVGGNRMSPADRPARLETWNCTHDFLFLCCQQITARNHQVPTLLICMKDGSLPLAEVTPPAQTAEGHIVELQCSSSLLMIMR